MQEEKKDEKKFEAGVEGDESSQASHLIQGALVKFTNEATWKSNDEEMSITRELTVIDIIRVVQKWANQPG